MHAYAITSDFGPSRPWSLTLTRLGAQPHRWVGAVQRPRPERLDPVHPAPAIRPHAVLGYPLDLQVLHQPIGLRGRDRVQVGPEHDRHDRLLGPPARFQEKLGKELPDAFSGSGARSRPPGAPTPAGETLCGARSARRVRHHRATRRSQPGSRSPSTSERPAPRPLYDLFKPPTASARRRGQSSSSDLRLPWCLLV